jgi:hypothetical protein
MAGQVPEALIGQMKQRHGLRRWQADIMRSGVVPAPRPAG